MIYGVLVFWISSHEVWGSTMATAEISVLSTLGICPVNLAVNYIRYLVEEKGRGKGCLYQRMAGRRHTPAIGTYTGCVDSCKTDEKLLSVVGWGAWVIRYKCS